MTANLRFQIFVSSTYTDLYPVRREVTEHILSMNHIPAGMEMFSASGQRQWKTIKKAIDNSDYYILIIGERYGSISEEEGISYTEMEFDYARSRGIPTLCFLPGEKYTTTKDKRDTELLKIELLEKFKQKVLLDQLCDFWETEEELVRKISAALYKIFVEEPGVGWVRGDTSDPEALSKLVKVMEENAKLTAKINDLESNVKNDMPALSIRINGHNFKKGNLVIKLPKVKEFEHGCHPITFGELQEELQKFISPDEVHLYNSTLPSKKAIDDYFIKSSLYMVGCSNSVKFSIFNSGPVKANNVLIRIYLPNGLKVLNPSDLVLLSEPYIDMPLHPIKLAELRKTSDKPESFTLTSRKISQGFSRKLKGNLRAAGQKTLNISNDKTVYGSKDLVRQATLHSLTSDIYFIPDRSGDFKLRVSMLCDEYREWSQEDIVITYTD
ncbi:DUF4062 domain-containing protein [Enterobacter roggenkampii]|uniref:DUF4062 domain-containing protein n=1 Tax=Enterobacter roggenkampii TaxID=1812935 RepID=UPI0013778C63|nr:DUF4062 domain-containing protein [Enterobacter roggenkampii]